MYRNKFEMMSNDELVNYYTGLLGSENIHSNCAELRQCEIAMIGRFLDDVRFGWKNDISFKIPFEKRCEDYNQLSK